MPTMKVTVSFTVPDAGLQALKRCAVLIERPFYGFLKSLVKRQGCWAPAGARIQKLDLGVEIETVEGELTCRELEETRSRETRMLIRRLEAKGYRTSALSPHASSTPEVGARDRAAA
jgi:hypothetical protein